MLMINPLPALSIFLTYTRAVAGNQVGWILLEKFLSGIYPDQANFMAHDLKNAFLTRVGKNRSERLAGVR